MNSVGCESDNTGYEKDIERLQDDATCNNDKNVRPDYIVRKNKRVPERSDTRIYIYSSSLQYLFFNVEP